MENNPDLIHADCLSALNHINKESIDLIYLDPPFYTQKVLKLKNRGSGKEYSFDDTWETVEQYIQFVEKRLSACKRVLKSTGAIFLHCDRKASHHLRLALDRVFGSEHFCSEIIWVYKRWSNSKKGLLNSHQVIYFYSKTEKFKFNTIFQNYSLTTNVDQIFQERQRDKNGKSIYCKLENGNNKILKEKKGVPLSDVWEIPYLNPKAKERVGYPTQKPVALLEKIITICSDEGDIVLDPFCGSGTTLVAAKLNNRRFIGIDSSHDAIRLAAERLENPIKTNSKLLNKGLSSFDNRDVEVTQLLEKCSATVVQRNSGIDGFIAIEGRIKPIPIRIQRENEEISETVYRMNRACRRNHFEKRIIVYRILDEYDQSCPKIDSVYFIALKDLSYDVIKASLAL